MASSSIASIHRMYQYDVFLSFRGEDVRKTFTDHLYDALQRQGIHTYKDDTRLEKGKNIKYELLNAIEESKLFIIVFSKNYASSSWCLDELVKIMECHKTTEQIAYPVFYDVDPSDVRKQHGAVGEAFSIHNSSKETEKWKEALKEAGNMAGWVLRNTADGHEAKLIKLIVEQISLELRTIHLDDDEHLIGMETRMQDVELSLEMGMNDVRMIGIKRIGGGGKTSLAQFIFDKISTEFDGSSFVENVREVSVAFGLRSLQKQILSNVFKNEQVTIDSVHQGKKMMKMRLRSIKVLIVLDDVDHISQLEALAGSPLWFKEGSRIIITTRDEQVLVAHRVNFVHNVNLLNDVEALCLFNRYAFGTNISNKCYKELSPVFVNYAAGLPLTLKVLGSFLCGKDEREWVDAIERLKTIPSKETLEKLELSYMGLETDYKEIFLDVACFLKGLLKSEAIRILESCGFHARIGLKVLEHKYLITISDDQYVGMHDRMQEMGRHIVRRDHPNEPNKHSRLWIQKEIQDVLTNDLGTDATRGVLFNSLLELGPDIVTQGFGNMKNLRFLHVGRGISYGFQSDPFYYNSKMKIDQVSKNLPDGLRYVMWDFYPQKSLPKTFQATNLIALEMRSSRIVQLWEGGDRKVLNNLRFLKLTGSKLRTLDLGVTPNLIKLDLGESFDLVELQSPIGSLKKLLYLNLYQCRNFKSFSFIKHLKSLEVLSITHLYLREFPDIIPEHCSNSLLELHFRYNDIKELPSSIGNLQKLVYLDLCSCKYLRNLPRSICDLRCLRELNLNGCRNLEELPEEIGQMECLENLDLGFTGIKYLPDSICLLKHMKTLDLSSSDLEKLPGQIGLLECLEILYLASCFDLRDIPEGICKLKKLKYIDLSFCFSLMQMPEVLENILVMLESMEGLKIKPWKSRRSRNITK